MIFLVAGKVEKRSFPKLKIKPLTFQNLGGKVRSGGKILYSLPVESNTR